MKRFSTEERRARIGARHLLARPGRSIERAADAVVGLHSSDPASVYLEARARVRGMLPEDLEEALYGRRSLVRMIGMRRTLFAVPRETAAIMDAACTKALVPAQRTRLIRMLEDQGIARDGAAWLRRVSARTMDVLRAGGELAATELTAEVPELATRLTVGAGKTWGGSMGVSTRVLFLLAVEGKAVRARPRGRWTSGQYRWSATETWLGAPLPLLDRGPACSELLRRYLRAFGPATLTDITWWTGWTLRLARATLADIEAVEVELEGRMGYLLPDDLRRTRAPAPWVAFLPGLDATVMGWKEREWYLGPHAEQLFDTNGNAGPTVWADGRVVGGWTQTAEGEVVVELLDEVGSRIEGKVEHERRDLQTWLGDVRITPRFRTPLEKRLAS